MVLAPTDVGPRYLTEEERQRQQHDQPTGRTKRTERTKKDLVEALESAGVVLQRKTNHTKKELQQFARNHGISLHVNKADITQGWEGRPKGLLQILWERGWIDPSMVNC